MAYLRLKAGPQPAQLRVELPITLHRMAFAKARAEGRPMAEVVRSFLREYVDGRNTLDEFDEPTSWVA